MEPHDKGRSCSAIGLIHHPRRCGVRYARWVSAAVCEDDDDDDNADSTSALENSNVWSFVFFYIELS